MTVVLDAGRNALDFLLDGSPTSGDVLTLWYSPQREANDIPESRDSPQESPSPTEVKESAPVAEPVVAGPKVEMGEWTLGDEFLGTSDSFRGVVIVPVTNNRDKWLRLDCPRWDRCYTIPRWIAPGDTGYVAVTSGGFRGDDIRSDLTDVSYVTSPERWERHWRDEPPAGRVASIDPDYPSNNGFHASYDGPTARSLGGDHLYVTAVTVRNGRPTGLYEGRVADGAVDLECVGPTKLTEGEVGQCVPLGDEVVADVWLSSTRLGDSPDLRIEPARMAFE